MPNQDNKYIDLAGRIFLTMIGFCFSGPAVAAVAFFVGLADLYTMDHMLICWAF